MPGPMNEDEFREKIYLSHKEHFDHLYELFKFAEATMSTYKGWAETSYQTAQWLIFARAYKSFDSIRRLCEIASCEDAAVVLRSLLNLMVVTRWISIDPEPRAKKYLAWYWIQMYSDLQIFKDVVPPLLIPIIQQRFEAAKVLFEYKNAAGETKLAKKWHEPEAFQIRDLFVQVDLEKQYEEAYKPLSGIEHSDATAFAGMILPMENDGDERRLEVQSDFWVPHYLRNSFQYFKDIFSICNEALHFADPKEFEKIVVAGMKFYADDMKAKGMQP